MTLSSPQEEIRAVVFGKIPIITNQLVNVSDIFLRLVDLLFEVGNLLVNYEDLAVEIEL